MQVETTPLMLSTNDTINCMVAIHPKALIEEITKLESTYSADDFGNGYKSTVADILGIITRLSASQIKKIEVGRND